MARPLGIQEIINEGGFTESEVSDLTEDIGYLVKKGIIEQHTGDDGNFYFSLTDIGNEIAIDLFDRPNEESPNKENPNE